MANKGNWEFSFYQKNHNANLEATNKLLMKPENCFNPKFVQSYIVIQQSKEQIIQEKHNNGEKLKTAEKIILKNYIDKEIRILKNDLFNISKYGSKAHPTSQEGKIHLIFKILEQNITHENKDFIANIYFKLREYNISSKLKKEYEIIIDKMNKILIELNLIELQFTKFHTNMPPLNCKGFTKFDDWQIQVINNIDNGISTIINAPTSAGKSVLSGYTTTKGKILFVVPTDALAWQMSSYIGHILNSNIPILTDTYQSIPTRNEMITLLNNSPAIVGTPNIILDFLPFINNNFAWIIFDEIHMIGKEEGFAMENIIKLLNNTNFIALSATISNTDEIQEWLSKITNKKIDKIICNKRFFNLQKYYYDNKSNEFKYLNPLALVTEEQILDGSLINKSLNPTPPDCWDFALKLQKYFDLNELEPNIYFLNINNSTSEIDKVKIINLDEIKIINLDEVNVYFNKLIIFIIEKYKSNPVDVMTIINSYKNEQLESQIPDLIKLAFKLKESHKLPTIIFQKDTNLCLTLVRQFAKNIELLENTKYPKLQQERIKQNKNLKKKINNDSNQSEKSIKQLLGHVQLKKDKYVSSIANVNNNDEEINLVSMQEPHEDFIFTHVQNFSEATIEEWVNNLKKYFPNDGIYYHFIIKLLWRGIGVYTHTLPDPYLRLVQTLACNKQLAIVFSDMSLVFGISMPFKTVVILRNEYNDDLDSMVFHQMAGRAGRRGLDKEGNIIFAGFSWNRIKELSISEPPKIKGMFKQLYSIIHAINLNTKYKWENQNDNFLDQTITKEEQHIFQYNINSNYNNSWKFALILNDINHLHMNWRLRYSNEGLIISFLIPYLRRAFESLDHQLEANQISIAHFLCKFISTYTTTSNNILNDLSLLLTYPYNTITTQLEELQIFLPKNIDDKIFLSIQNNSLIKDAKLLEFGNKILIIQHFCFHSKILGLCRLLGKLLTRIWWICHTSSPIMKSISVFD